ncbi:hypothetical protein Taro_014959 [Colocasia esculenta]|uniref:HRDC domain-containing protein n=1 Tax=Colocasia esculenta TaxID=4460 RepID=A0A843UGA1_COLES|nr:hypothetical protein [Colocasia esculenta]
MLLDVRTEIAKAAATAPYAICGDQTITKITKARPTTRARLANIDGVNQNFPGRAAPIKERTVFEYILEAARERYEINWVRFCDEVGLTHEVISEIHRAIAKVGSRERMKPIKEELSEDVTYDHIKTCLVMDDLGMSAKFLDSKCSSVKNHSEVPALHSPSSNDMASQKIEGGLEDETVPLSFQNDDLCNGVFSSCSHENTTFRKQPRVNSFASDETAEKKSRKMNHEENYKLEASQDAILQWLGKHDGVSLPDILGHFNNSSKEYVVDLLGCLEGQFFIFKKNDLYRVM